MYKTIVINCLSGTHLWEIYLVIAEYWVYFDIRRQLLTSSTKGFTRRVHKQMAYSLNYYLGTNYRVDQKSWRVRKKIYCSFKDLFYLFLPWAWYFTTASTYPMRRELVLLEDLACVTNLFRCYSFYSERKTPRFPLVEVPWLISGCRIFWALCE